MIKDKNIDPTANSIQHSVTLHTCGALSNGQANTTVVDAWIAPFAGKIDAVMSYCGAVVATGTVDLFINSATALSGAQAPVALTATDITSALITTTFAAGDTLSLRCVCTGGSGALTKPTIQISIRPLAGKELSGY